MSKIAILRISGMPTFLYGENELLILKVAIDNVAKLAKKDGHSVIVITADKQLKKYLTNYKTEVIPPINKLSKYKFEGTVNLDIPPVWNLDWRDNGD